MSAHARGGDRAVAAMPPMEVERLLVAHGAGATPHSGRTLLDHLIGTYWLLSDWGCQEDVCLAGLLHSAYGTAQFARETVPLADRAELRRLVGREAERLAHLFSACSSTADRIRAVATGSFRSRHENTEIRLCPEDARHILVIECANLLEQGAADGLREVLNKLSFADRAALLGRNVAQALAPEALTTDGG